MLLPAGTRSGWHTLKGDKIEGGERYYDYPIKRFALEYWSGDSFFVKGSLTRANRIKTYIDRGGALINYRIRFAHESTGVVEFFSNDFIFRHHRYHRGNNDETARRK